MPGRDAGRQPPWPDRCSDGRPVAPAQQPRRSGTQPYRGVTPDPVAPAPTGSRIRGAVVAGVVALVPATSVTMVVKSCEPEPCPPPSSGESVGESVTGPGISRAAVVGTFVQTLTGPASFDPGQPSSSVPTSIVPPKGCDSGTATTDVDPTSHPSTTDERDWWRPWLGTAPWLRRPPARSRHRWVPCYGWPKSGTVIEPSAARGTPGL